MTRYRQRIKKYDPEVLKVKKILKELKIPYVISWTEKRMWYTGMFKNGKIYIYVRWFKGFMTRVRGYDRYTTQRCTVQEFLSTVFHEVGHVIQRRAEMYADYHEGLNPKHGYETFKKWALQAYPAEKLADMLGKRFMRIHFPKIPFQGAYAGKMGRKLVIHTTEAIQDAYFSRKKSLTPILKKIRL